MSLLRADSDCIQWKFVGAGCQERKDKWKRERCAHQATGQATIQWCPGVEQPKHLYQWRGISERETAACTDRSRVQSTGGIGALWRQRADATPRIPPGRVESQAAWSKTDRTTGRRIAWSHFEVQKRLAEAEIANVDVEATMIKETEDIASNQAQLAELEPLLASSAGFRKADGPDSGMPEWLANTLSSIAKHVQESSNIDRDAVAQSLLGLLVPGPPPIPPDALRSGTLDNTTDMCDVSNRGTRTKCGSQRRR